MSKPKLSKRHPLSKKTLRALLEEVIKTYPKFPLANPELVEEAAAGGTIMYIFDGVPSLFRVSGRLVPTLRLLAFKGYEWLPHIYIDRGATRAVARGADLMLPGVRGVVGEFKPGDIVVAVDEEAKTPVMVGEALIDSRAVSESIGKSVKGKAVKSIHYINDELTPYIV
ncbi:MAG: DUF1947 domain-containing protein [Thermoprotei archaeon]|nr:DUF1947 domain-containing protein [Thermoprotei archaeon]